MTLSLHSYWRSTASYRVRIALNLKGADYEQTTYDLRVGAHRDAAFLALAPQGLVPALRTDDGVLTQSLAILEWIDDRWGAPPLLPDDRFGRAIVRSMSSLIAADIHPLNNLRVLETLRSEFQATPTQIDGWIARWMLVGFQALEQLVDRYSGIFAYGDSPGIADCVIVPQVYSAERFNVDLEAFPNIRRVANAAMSLSAFAAAHPANQPDADAP